MSRRSLAIAAAVLAVAVLGALALVGRGSTTRPNDQPFRADPAKQFGDDADLMRRLERKKLVDKAKR